MSAAKPELSSASKQKRRVYANDDQHILAGPNTGINGNSRGLVIVPGGGNVGSNELGEREKEADWKSQSSIVVTNKSGPSFDTSSDKSAISSAHINLPITTANDKSLDITTARNSLSSSASNDLILHSDSGAVSANATTAAQSSNRPLQPIHYYQPPSNQQQPQPPSPINKPHNQQAEARLRFKSILASSSIQESDEFVDVNEQELKPRSQQSATGNSSCTRPFVANSIRCDSVLGTIIEDKGENLSQDDNEVSLSDRPFRDDEFDSLSEDELYFNDNESNSRGRGQLLRLHDRSNQRQRSSRISINYDGLKHSFKRRLVNLFFGNSGKTRGGFGGGSKGRSPVSDDNDNHIQSAYSEDKDLLTGTSKYHSKRKQVPLGKTFRGSYKFSRTKITMAILRKIANSLIHPSTLALLGAFLIHVTLGTVYTLSNINSYMTSYMRKHGSPNATYGGSMWISSSYAVGQGFSMVLGGYIEKRFSARLSCFIGCALHSLSTISTSWAIDHGPLAVLLTYGFIPGFGCGLAYMTPMSNGFGWFPNRKGVVAGVILAGFGIGTFVFNMAQTAYVNPDNLSPPVESNGYFTQESILIKVPHLFVFIGCIYAAMQFVGCCLLFKPPNPYLSSSDAARPILVETEMPLKESIRRREFLVLFLVYGITTPGILFVNSMLKEYGQLFIGDDMYLAWTGSMGSLANASGRLAWGLAIDRFSFTQCFSSITIIFATLMLLMPFKFILSSKLLYLLCTLGIFGSFSGWMSTYPVHLSRVFGRTNSGMIYGLIFMSQSFGGIFTALGAHYLIDHYSRFVPFFCVVFLEMLGLSIYHLFYPK